MMGNRKLALLYPDYFDSTTASTRTLKSAAGVFDEIDFFYWARKGVLRDNDSEVFKQVNFKSFSETAKARSLQIILLSFKFQYWLICNLRVSKPKVIIAFTFWTVIPALLYKLIFDRKSKVVYDLRDYIAVSFKFHKFFIALFKLLDNILVKAADLVVFPDNQYFSHYGLFKLKEDKYFILPNSSEDISDNIRQESTHDLYEIDKSKNIIPIIGYFSDTRGKKMLFDAISSPNSNFHFVIAGDFRDEELIRFFQKADCVTFLGRIPYEEALAIIRDSYLVPMAYDPNIINYKHAMPTKFYDALMVGTPIVCSEGQLDLAKEVSKYKLGEIIEYNNSEEYIKVLSGNKKYESNSLRNHFLTMYDFSFFKDKLRERFQKLI